VANRAGRPLLPWLAAGRARGRAARWLIPRRRFSIWV